MLSDRREDEILVQRCRRQKFRVRAGEIIYLFGIPSFTTHWLFSQATVRGGQHTIRQISAGLQPC